MYFTLCRYHFLFSHFSCLIKKEKVSTECFSKVETLAILVEIKITTDKLVFYLFATFSFPPLPFSFSLSKIHKLETFSHKPAHLKSIHLRSHGTFFRKLVWTLPSADMHYKDKSTFTNTQSESC